MTVFTEGRHTAEFLVSEANGHRSREAITVASGADLQAGTVVGKLTSGGQYKAITPGTSDGAQNAAGVLFKGTRTASATEEGTIIARDAEVNGAHLVWPNGISDGNKNTAIAALAALGIIVR